jgi:L-asparaginase
MERKIVVLGTGGTIAGVGVAGQSERYVAAQVDVSGLLAPVAQATQAWHEGRLWMEQVCQTDSKDMSWALLRHLGQRCVHWLQDPQTQGLVVTHGTDTLEETAYVLHRLLPWRRLGKKVVLTGAMRPTTAPQPDGPANLQGALQLAAAQGPAGVWVSFAGDVHHALHVQKIDPTGLHAFSSLSEPASARVDAGGVHWHHGLHEQDWATDPPSDAVWDCEGLPRVEIVSSHSCANGQLVLDLLHTRGDAVRGMVVAATGNGTIAQELERALALAVKHGVRVVRATRCARGRVLSDLDNPFDMLAELDSHPLSPVKARWALMLALMCEDLRRAG